MVLLIFGVFKGCGKACGRFFAGFSKGVFNEAAGKFSDADVAAAKGIVGTYKAIDKKDYELARKMVTENLTTNKKEICVEILKESLSQIIY